MERQEKAGWDTPLAAPFRDLQRLPAVFHRAENELAWIARSPNTLYAIRTNCVGDLEFISCPDDDPEDVRRHYLEPSTWPSNLSLRDALNGLSTNLRRAHRAKEQVVDIETFVRFAQELPFRVELVGEDQAVEPTALQWFAFDAIFQARGERDYEWMVGLGEPPRIFRHQRTSLSFQSVICLANTLPFPLHDLTPTYEVLLDEEGLSKIHASSCAIHPAFLRVGGPRPNIVEELKACRDLSDDTLAELRRFATDASLWVVE